MFTRCPQCSELFAVYAANLRSAMGMVRCTRCQNVFNALETLMDEGEIAGQAVTEVHDQFAIQELGDRQIMDVANARNLLAAAREGLAAKLAEALPATAPDIAKGTAKPAPAAPSDAMPVQAPLRAPSLLSRILPSDVLLAVRNLLRNGRRTVLALGAISFGVIALMLAGGFMEWVFWAMRESVIQGQIGHIEVTRPGFLTEGGADPNAYLLPAEAPEMAALEHTPGVRVLAPRVTLSGLASFGDTSIAFVADAVYPEREVALNAGFGMVSGRHLARDDTNGIIIGTGLAAILGVKTGDKLTLLANTRSGGLNGVEVDVIGVFSTANKVWNDSALRMHIDTARSLVGLEGSHLWVLLLNDTSETDATLASLRERFQDVAGGLEFTPWYALADFYNKTVSLFSRQMNVVRLIIGVIIIFSITNVLAMSVMQRTSEVGTLMAVGLRRRKVLQVFFSEGVVLGLIGALLGVSVGWSLAEVISYFGIPMPPAPGMDKGFTAEIMVTWPLALSTFLLALVTTAIASVYPAWKASRMEIVNALRHSR